MSASSGGAWGPERLDQGDDGRWTLAGQPLHAGALLELRRPDGAWSVAMFVWQTDPGGPLPALLTDERTAPEAFTDDAFAALPLRWAELPDPAPTGPGRRRPRTRRHLRAVR